MSSSPEETSEKVTARAPTAEELPTLRRARAAAFGMPIVPDVPEINDVVARLTPLDRQVAVFEPHTDRILGGCASYAFELSVPGGALVPVAGLASVGILPTDTGRGGLSAMMQTHVEQCLDHGDAASALMASESGLYGRYGYGMATEFCEWQTDTDKVQLRADMTPPGGTVELLTDLDEAARVLGEIHDRFIGQSAGGIRRTDDWWHLILRSPEKSWVGGGEQFVSVVRSDNGRAEGYCLWTIDEGASGPDTVSGHGRSHSRVVVAELVGVTAEAETRLLLFLQSIPLTTTMSLQMGPTDLAARDQLSDPRQLWQNARVDMLWLRPLDIERLLAERRWSGSGSVVIGVTDSWFPELGGTFGLNVTEGTGTVTRADASPEVTVTAETFGAMYLGGTSPMRLHRAGRLDGTDQGVRQLHDLMHTPRQPFTLSKF